MGTLYVVATPIGNLEDMSARAIRILREVTVIAAEDTRHSRRLLTHFAIRTPLLSYHEHNQRQRRDRFLEALSTGDVALITDAGTPAISDPGVDLVREALAAGFRVSPIPGPSALTAAISASGLVEGPFTSLGFLPRESGERKYTIARGAASGTPLVILESAQRLSRTLAELLKALGDRRAVILREMTKLHEEVKPGTLGTLAEWAAGSAPRGEVVIVVDGAAPRPASDDDIEAVIGAMRRSGLSVSQTAREAAAITGLSRSVVYEMVIAIDARESVGLESEFPAPDEDALQQPFRDKKRPQGRQSRTDEG